MLSLKLTSGRPSFIKSIAYSFKNMERFSDLEFITDKYRLGDTGTEFEFVMDCTHDESSRSIVTWDPLGETVQVALPRLAKRRQRELLNQVIMNHGLDFLTHELTDMKVQGDEITLTEMSLLKTNFGSNCIGTVLLDAGVHQRDRYVNMSHGLYLLQYPDDPRDSRNIEGVINSGFYAEKLIPNVKDEYRVVLFTDGEHYISKRHLVENHQSLRVPVALEKVVHEFNQYELPAKVLEDLLKLATELDIFTYSIDLYCTEDGKWGIFEYSPEYGLKSATDDLANTIAQKQIVHYLDRLPSKSVTVNSAAIVIQVLREDLGYTIDQVAERLGMTSEEYVANFENPHADTSWELIGSLLYILNVKEDDITDMMLEQSRMVNNIARNGFRKARVGTKISHLTLEHLSHNESLIKHLELKEKCE